MTDFNKEFSAISNFTYFNTPATGLVSKSVTDYRIAQNRDLLENASKFRDRNADVLPESREKIASFFNGEANRIALVPAFSFGFNILLESLDAGSKVLLLKNDYPSINLAVEARDFSIKYAEINSTLEANISAQFQKDPPDVFIFSIVQYLNGVKINLDFIKKLKQDFPKTLIVADGTQYLGTEVFSFKNSGIDILGASAYKWLNAGFGVGFFMFNRGVEKTISPKAEGYGSHMGKYKQDPKSLIGRFEPGHLDTANIGSLIKALCLQEDIGLDRIQEKISALTKKAKTEFQNLSLLEGTVLQRKAHSPIFNLKADKTCLEALAAHNIICMQRGNGIRVGFHFYNTTDDLDQLFTHLKAR